MEARSIKVKIVRETSNTITIKLLSLNRDMPVPRKEFMARMEDGLYEVINPEVLEAAEATE
ncbi:MAG: hypothetical protein H6555_04170 [Lewinellaceae bacterium]|nr:hypothetical protein [Lewinellaceae bacterium]